MNSNIPIKLSADIQSLSSSLTESLSENLVSVVLYGGMVKMISLKRLIGSK